MRKLLSIVLGIALFALLIPVFTSAQPMGVSNCCKLNHQLEYEQDDGTVSTCSKGNIMGPSGVSQCVLQGTEKTIDCNTESWGAYCVINTIYNVTDWIFYLALFLALIIGVWAGVEFMTSSGSPEQVAAARSKLIYMGVGLLVAALAKAIPAIVMAMIS